jgi:hypothetical protein
MLTHEDNYEDFIISNCKASLNAKNFMLRNKEEIIRAFEIL